MTAVMVVTMTIDDPGWIEDYFAAVPQLLHEHGATPYAGSRAIQQIEGGGSPPDRVAVLTFPSMAAVDAFMADPRYQHFRAARERGSRSAIYVFENDIVAGELA